MPLSTLVKHHTAAAQWERWQSSAVATRLLSAEAREQGYTVVRIHPACREAFLIFEGLMTTYAHLVSRRACPPLAQTLFRGWLTWTRRLVAVLQRVRADKPVTLPPCPCQEPHA